MACGGATEKAVSVSGQAVAAGSKSLRQTYTDRLAAPRRNNHLVLVKVEAWPVTVGEDNSTSLERRLDGIARGLMRHCMTVFKRRNRAWAQSGSLGELLLLQAEADTRSFQIVTICAHFSC